MCNVNPLVRVKNGKLDEFNIWSDALKLLNNPQKFIEILLEFMERVEQLQVPESNYKSIRIKIKRADFDPGMMVKKSKAAAGLSQWVLSIVAYHDIQKQVYEIQTPVVKKPIKPKKLNVPKTKPETIRMNLQDFDISSSHHNNPADTPMFKISPEDINK